MRRDDWDEIYARPKADEMHSSTAFLMAFFTSVATATCTVYAIERFNLLHKQEPAVVETVVPDLRGFSEADARTNTQASHLALLVASHEPSADAKPGTVIRQSVPAGQHVPREHPVSVIAYVKITAVCRRVRRAEVSAQHIGHRHPHLMARSSVSDHRGNEVALAAAVSAIERMNGTDRSGFFAQT